MEDEKPRDENVQRPNLEEANLFKEKPTASDQWSSARKHLKEAERAAGIEELLNYLNKKELNEHNAFIASGVRRRRGYRDIVFAVANVEIRRRIIHFNRMCHGLCRAAEQEELQVLQKRIKIGGRWIRKFTLWSAVILGMGTVWLGSKYGSQRGALIATVASVLFGVDSIRRADRVAIANVEDAKEKARQKETFLAELGTESEFSETEEKTGHPDRRWQER